MVSPVLPRLERRQARNGVKPIEHTIQNHEIVGSICHSDSRDRKPRQKRRGSKRNAGKQQALEGEHNGRVFDLYPPELKRRPNTDEKIHFGAEEGGEETEQDGIESREELGTEEEGDLGGDEGEPNPEEGAGLEIEGIEDVGAHEAEREGGDDRGAAEVEHEGGAGDESDSNTAVVDEAARGRVSGILERSRASAGEAAVGG